MSTTTAPREIAQQVSAHGSPHDAAAAGQPGPRDVVATAPPTAAHG